MLADDFAPQLPPDELATLADYGRMKVGLSQQQSLLEELGLDIHPDPDRPADLDA